VKEEIDRFIEGLECIRDNVRGVSFYNDTGSWAYVACNGLTDEQQETLSSLGWVQVTSAGAYFKEWGGI
jgi:hypothetical protein